jgi:hypothetical protein
VDGGRVADGADLPTVTACACADATDAVDNSERTKDFTVSRHFQGRQVSEEVFVGGDVGQAEMRSAGLVRTDAIGDSSQCGVHAERAPPSAARVHAELTALTQHRVGELGGPEWPALVGVGRAWRASAREGLLEDTPAPQTGETLWHGARLRVPCCGARAAIPMRRINVAM